MPLVSVIMPAYNSERYIAEAITSILEQTHQNIELIIFDDGSTDGTRSVIDQFSDVRIIRMDSDKNKGVVYARNAMIEKASGEYIALMDADDVADKMRLQLQLKILQSGVCDICGSAQWVMNETTGRIKKSKDKFSDSDLRALLAVYCSLCNSSVTGRAEIFKRFKYDTTVLTSEDYYLWTRIAASGFRFLNMRERLIIYRQYPAQTSSIHLDKFKKTTMEVQERYLEQLSIPLSLKPIAISWRKRFMVGLGLLRALELRFPGISFGAKLQIYARFQFRKNGIWTPFTRLERYVAASLVGLF